jgi:hypothetical protein
MSNETMLNIINAFIMLFLLVSVGTNVILGWYIGKMNEKLKYAIQRHGEITDGVKNFVEHVEVINGMELYSGDEVLVNLLKHSRAVVEEIEEYTDMMAEEEEIDEEEG